jgi:sugar-phosphatase
MVAPELKLSDFQAVIFDMDGVLIDSEPLWKIAMEEVFHAIGSKLTKQDFQKTVGLRLDEVIHFWFHHEGWKNCTPQDIEAAIVAKMCDLILETGCPLPGVLATLEFIKSQGVKIGLATSSYGILIETVLTQLNIHSYFDFTHSAENEAYGKPHPAVYLSVANYFKVEPSKCLVIEDSLNGIISGKAAKMKVVCIPEKTHYPEPKLILADYHFEDMECFLNALK